MDSNVSCKCLFFGSWSSHLSVCSRKLCAYRIDALGAAPTTNAQLGFWAQGALVATQTSTTSNTIYSVVLPAGSWILVGNATYAAGVTFAVLSISTSNNALDTFYQVVMQNVSGGGTCINITRIASISSTTTFYLVAQASTVANISSAYFQVMRVG
jgi:hypothetical protein